MKLKEYLSLTEPGTEITCWDKDVDSEFYFYSKEPDSKPLFGDEFVNVDKCEKLLAEHLEIVKIHETGIEVNLYELLENPAIIKYAKENMFEPHQYEDDSDVVMMLFDDNIKNFSNGYEGFSELMVGALNVAFSEQRVSDKHIKPDCPLIGQDGNIFNLMAMASKTLKDNGLEDQASEMCKRIISSDSYYQALNVLGEYVNIISAEREVKESLDVAIGVADKSKSNNQPNRLKLSKDDLNREF